MSVQTIQQQLHPSYITDEKGERTGVVLTISAFNQLLEDLEDLAAIAERRNEPTISHDEIRKELKADGIL